VLNLFELLERRGEEFENDSTIIIEPLIDLTLSLHGRQPAKEAFERILARNYQNGVLIDLYSQFLLEYFPNATHEIEQQKAVSNPCSPIFDTATK